MINNSKMVKQIKKYNPCKTGINWLQYQISWDEAWKNCKHPTWMLWLIMKVTLDKEQDHETIRHMVLCFRDFTATYGPFDSDHHIQNLVLFINHWLETGEVLSSFFLCDADMLKRYKLDPVAKNFILFFMNSIACVMSTSKSIRSLDEEKELGLQDKQLEVVRNYYPNPPLKGNM